jgi:predicted DsbA family dithiol-disulfide isomerase
MRLDVWADLVCPWCYVGKRRLERALAEFPHTEDVEIFFRSFQLDPRAPVGRTRLQVEVLVERYGMSEARALALESETARTAEAEGLEFRFEGALTGNTFDAHRLVHLARDRGMEGTVVDRFYRAQFAEQRSLFEKGSLVELAAEAGLDPSESQTVLDQGAYAEAVLADVQEAVDLRATGVPFFLLDHRYGISGAQSPAVFLGALTRSWEDTHPSTSQPSAGSVPAGPDGQAQGR